MSPAEDPPEASAPPRQPDAPEPGVRDRHTPTALDIQPRSQLAFSDSDDIGGVAFSPDSTAMYVQLRLEAIDPVDVVRAYWPEALGAGVGIAALVLLWLALRVVRRRRRPGHWHCRRCNYDLTGLAVPLTDDGAAPCRCPECGVDVANRTPVRGRRLSLRLAPLLVPVALLLGGYATLWIAAVPRATAMNRDAYWPSTTLASWVQSWQVAWLMPFLRSVDRIVAVDPASGRRLRTVYTGSFVTYFPLVLTPDGGSLFLSGGSGRLLRVDTRSGRVLGAAVRPGGSETTGGWQRVIGFSKDGAEAYAVHLHDAELKTRVYGWDLASGRQRLLAETDAYEEILSGGRRGTFAREYFVQSVEPLRFVSVPDFMERYSGQRDYVARLQGAGRPPDREIPWPAITGPTQPPVLSADGRRFYIQEETHAVRVMDLHTGEETWFTTAGLFDTGLDQLVLSRNGRWLFWSMHGGAILARDLNSESWAARCHYDEELIAPALSVSPDARWLVGVGFYSRASADGTAGECFDHELLIYDLTPLASARPAVGPR